MDNMVDVILQKLLEAGIIVVEVSARHVHLSAKELEALFGAGAALTPKRGLSQPGQYLSEERVTVVGPKGRKERVAILGPVRPATQIELSITDCTELGLKAPLRESGKVEGSAAVLLEGPKGTVKVSQGAIVAHSHVHLSPEDAAVMGLIDGQRVSVEVLTERPLVFRNVVARVNENFRTRMHIDFDEANAAMVGGFTLGRIIK
jgi:putative phosphotransacetylase